jgi:predicted nucleic acid-binding protein
MPGVVSNASPLILLSGVGEFGRLQELFGVVFITPEVFDEVVVRGKGKPGSTEVSAAPFIHSRAVVAKDRISDLRARSHIAAGEASTIILADELRADVVLIDEKAARESARELGLKVAGTMRVLELAFERKLIADLRSTYLRLKAGSAHISPDLLNASLARFQLPPIKG